MHTDCSYYILFCNNNDYNKIYLSRGMGVVCSFLIAHSFVGRHFIFIVIIIIIIIIPRESEFPCARFDTPIK